MSDGRDLYYRLIGISLMYLTAFCLTAVSSASVGLLHGATATSRFELYQTLTRLSMSLKEPVGNHWAAGFVDMLVQPIEGIVYAAAFAGYEHRALVEANVSLLEASVWVIGIVAVVGIATGVVMSVSGERPSFENARAAAQVLGWWR